MDSQSLPVLSALQPIIGRCRWVVFHPERLEAAVELWDDSLAGRHTWHHPCHFFDGTAETVRWIFVVDVLNHCFWPDKGRPTWTVRYQGRDYSGYWGLAASLKRAREEGFPITDPGYLAELSEGDLREIFRGAREAEIPLLGERLSCLREAGQVILSRWRGNLVHLLEETRGSAVKTVQQVVATFGSFRDEAHYRERTVYFWKRAQLFVADVHAAFDGKGWGKFDDLGNLTAFADYKLPQVLREMGVIEYHQDLANRVDQLVKLAAGSDEEIEIRAMTIWAVEALKGALGRRGKAVTSAAIDQWLWQFGQLAPYRRRPYHRCRTIFY